MWNVIRISKGKRTIVFTGDLSKARDFIKKIRDSQRNGISTRNGTKIKVEYKLEKI